MAKLTLTPITDLNNETGVLNANNALVEAAIDNTLSRDGTEPNEMLANLNMGGFSILNVANLDIMSNHVFEEEGTPTGAAGSVTTVNFVGAAITAAQVGPDLTVTVVDTPALQQIVYNGPSSTVWNKPANATKVHVALIGGGGGGGGGSKPYNNGNEGMGGGGGGFSEFLFDAVTLPPSLTVTVGDGGIGGIGADPDTSSSQSGAVGATGENTTFGAYLMAYGGEGGQTGSTVTDGGAGLTSNGGNGIGSSSVPSVASGLRTPRYAPSGGGSGGGNVVAPVAGIGNAVFYNGTVAGGTAGVNDATTPVAGGNGVDATVVGTFGTGGGGGGGSSNSGVGVDGALGGNGGYPGGGGGAGGNGGVNTGGSPFRGGADGGLGNAGLAIVTTYF